jgi:hypothetical protein
MSLFETVVERDWQKHNWLIAMATSRMAKRIRNVRVLAERDTPEGFYWSERCPSNVRVKR